MRTLPSSVTSIEGSVFFSCTSLTSIAIPNGVTSIGDDAFRNCTNLTDIYYGGSVTQRMAIKSDISDFRDNLTDATIHYNSPTAGKPSFTDVSAGKWYTASVAWAVERNITSGTTSTTFAPGQTCTQTQILTFLYRAVRGGGTASAADMDAAISWARGKGMIDASFVGSKPCTRATAVSYIWQALDKPTFSTNSSFTDVPANAKYAAAVSWAVENGVTNGTNTDGTIFSPDSVCTRGHIVTFLHRAYVPEVCLK